MRANLKEQGGLVLFKWGKFSSKHRDKWRCFDHTLALSSRASWVKITQTEPSLQLPLLPLQAPERVGEWRLLALLNQVGNLQRKQKLG